MKYKSFKEEARLCLQRHRRAGTKVGDLVLFFHHGVAIEPLPEPPKRRLNFYPIGKSDETEEQWGIRAHWFRPIPKRMYEKLPKELVAAWKKAKAAEEEYLAARENPDIAKEKCFVVVRKADKAWRNLDAALIECAPQINALIKKYFPDCPWDGHSLRGIR